MHAFPVERRFHGRATDSDYNLETELARFRVVYRTLRPEINVLMNLKSRNHASIVTINHSMQLVVLYRTQEEPKLTVLDPDRG